MYYRPGRCDSRRSGTTPLAKGRGVCHDSLMNKGNAMSDAEKVLHLQALLEQVIFSLEMTQYDIEDGEVSHSKEVLADTYHSQMCNILHA
jgi:hypothetical protein